MFTNARLTKSATALAVLFVVVGGYLLLTHTAMAQAPDVDEMTGRNIRYVTADAMYLANEQWLLYACDLPAGQTDNRIELQQGFLLVLPLQPG